MTTPVPLLRLATGPPSPSPPWKWIRLTQNHYWPAPDARAMEVCIFQMTVGRVGFVMRHRELTWLPAYERFTLTPAHREWTARSTSWERIPFRFASQATGIDILFPPASPRSVTCPQVFRRT